MPESFSYDDRKDERRPIRLTRRGRVVAGSLAFLASSALILGAAAVVRDMNTSDELRDQLASPEALDRYQQGKIDQSKVVLLGHCNPMTPYRMAELITSEQVETGQLATIIAIQANAQSYPGVDGADLFVLPKNYVSGVTAASCQVVTTLPKSD